ncbi:MAG: sulfite exporter TauE/SafE family protein [Akkermansiaceae bacterium]|jgi:sulfite exporter TauE/SafE|nr:sulfite exporter TauE/SafE family protein [Akkermansiaceae bacterium]
MTTFAALLAGLATSLHCAGMCGPIACGLGTLAKSEGERLTAATLYHGTRLVSYGLIGAVCGALGRQPLKWFFDSPAVLLPWVLVAVLLAMALGLDKRVPRPAVFNRLTARARFKAGRLSAYGGASAMGFLTPLLPCGPLYLVFGAALLAGSAAKGAEFTLAFGLGTVPLLWLAQHQFHRIRAKLTPLAMNRLRRGLALVTALMLAWRLHGTIPAYLPGARPDAPQHPEELPSCCH